MASIGIDFGNAFCCVATFKNGKVDVISNEHDKRLTPSYVAFTEDGRLFGDTAQRQAPLNLRNTVYNTKRLIGRKFNDELVQQYQDRCGYKIVEVNHRLAIPVLYREKSFQLYPEQITAMILENLKQIAKETLGQDVRKAVISVPAHFTAAQHSAIKKSGIIAGFETVETVDEPTLAAVAFALNLNTPERRNVLVFDLGAGKLEVGIFVLEKNKIARTVVIHGDPEFGGDDLDSNIVKYMMKKDKIKPANPKALYRLRASCEKAKKSLSAASRTRIQVDCLTNDEQYRSTLNRNEFEEINGDEFDKIKPILIRVIAAAKMQKAEINDIVLVGGSTRIPKVRQILSEFFNKKELNKTLNPDEAVAYGAAYWAGNYLRGNGRDQGIDMKDLKVLIEENNVFNQEDEELRQISEAKNKLEQYIYHIKESTQNPGNGKINLLDGKLKPSIEDKCKRILAWLDKNEKITLGDVEKQKKELESLCNTEKLNKEKKMPEERLKLPSIRGPKPPDTPQSEMKDSRKEKYKTANNSNMNKLPPITKRKCTEQDVKNVVREIDDILRRKNLEALERGKLSGPRTRAINQLKKDRTTEQYYKTYETLQTALKNFNNSYQKRTNKEQAKTYPFGWQR